MAVSLLQVAYLSDLLQAREMMLANDGYKVVSALGNDQGMTVAGSGHFDIIVVGSSERHSTRHTMVRWLKKHLPDTPVTVLLAHEAEHFPDADCETMSEDPQVWLAAVRETCGKYLH